jgi:hypothetical protein
MAERWSSCELAVVRWVERSEDPTLVRPAPNVLGLPYVLLSSDLTMLRAQACLQQGAVGDLAPGETWDRQTKPAVCRTGGSV